MILIKAALGLKLTDEQWRRLEVQYDRGGQLGNEPARVSGRRRSWGEYQQVRDQRGWAEA